MYSGYTLVIQITIFVALLYNIRVVSHTLHKVGELYVNQCVGPSLRVQ